MYKAEDLHYDRYQNDWDTEPRKASKWMSPPAVKSREKISQSSSPSNSQDLRRQREPRFVAIKKIYVTSSPIRIQNELELLHDLRGCHSICPLITALRHQDQVVAVLPHFQHQDFRVSKFQCYPHIDLLIPKSCTIGVWMCVTLKFTFDVYFKRLHLCIDMV